MYFAKYVFCITCIHEKGCFMYDVPKGFMEVNRIYENIIFQGKLQLDTPAAGFN